MTEDNTNVVASPALSVSPRENRVRKNKNFLGAVQLNHLVFVGFNHGKFCCSGDGFVFFCKLQQRCPDLYPIKNKFLKILV